MTNPFDWRGKPSIFLKSSPSFKAEKSKHTRSVRSVLTRDALAREGRDPAPDFNLKKRPERKRSNGGD